MLLEIKYSVFDIFEVLHDIFFSTFPIFFKESNWENLGLNWEKKILFCIGNGADIIRPQNQADREPCIIWIDMEGVLVKTHICTPIPLSPYPNLTEPPPPPPRIEYE